MITIVDRVGPQDGFWNAAFALLTVCEVEVWTALSEVSQQDQATIAFREVRI